MPMKPPFPNKALCPMDGRGRSNPSPSKLLGVVRYVVFGFRHARIRFSPVPRQTTSTLSGSWRPSKSFPKHFANRRSWFSTMHAFIPPRRFMLVSRFGKSVDFFSFIFLPILLTSTSSNVFGKNSKRDGSARVITSARNTYLRPSIGSLRRWSIPMGCSFRSTILSHN